MSSEIKVTLANEQLWRLFAPYNEMIVAKMPRKLSPTLEYNVEGLSPIDLYSLEVWIERTDDRRYSFKKREGRWKEKGEGKPRRINENVQHIFGYQTGAEWMESPISFANLKVSNNEKIRDWDPSSTILLENHHHYVPILIIRKWETASDEAVVVAKISFDITAFYASWDIKNPKIKKLKSYHSSRASPHKRNRPPTPTIPIIIFQESEDSDQYQNEDHYSPSNCQPENNYFCPPPPRSSSNFIDYMSFYQPHEDPLSLMTTNIEKV